MADADLTILKALLQSRGQFVSGNTLAGQLGLSRVGVWARLEKLRAKGFQFEAARHRGYRFLREPERLHGELVRAHLELRGCPVQLHFFPEIDSTNAEAERRLAAAEATPMAILASRQTKGRGRLGRDWHSPEDGNIYLSLVFRPHLPPARLQSFTLWMGLRLCACLHRVLGVEPMVKWPNDLFVGRRKFGGILTEARINSDLTRDLTFGIGLNINSELAGWPEAVRSTATSLREAVGQPLQVNQLAAETVVAAHEAYEAYVQRDVGEELAVLWRHYDLLAGKEVQAQGEHGPLVGVAEGIDTAGALQLRRADGRVIAVRAGEVTLGSASLAAG